MPEEWWPLEGKKVVVVHSRPIIKTTDWHGGQGGPLHHEGLVKFKRRVGHNAAENDGGTTPTTVVLEPQDHNEDGMMLG